MAREVVPTDDVEVEVEYEEGIISQYPLLAAEAEDRVSHANATLVRAAAVNPMSLVEIYQCLCDKTRLRILNLLMAGDLCVCHVQEILDEPQVKISKHLSYLRKRGLVESRKEANWMIYSLPSRRSRELAANLACLQDCLSEDGIFKRDSEKRNALGARFSTKSPICCAPKVARPKTRSAGRGSALPAGPRSRT
jgi:ArsR family transcriptional regulator